MGRFFRLWSHSSSTCFTHTCQNINRPTNSLERNICLFSSVLQWLHQLLSYCLSAVWCWAGTGRWVCIDFSLQLKLSGEASCRFRREFIVSSSLSIIIVFYSWLKTENLAHTLRTPSHADAKIHFPSHSAQYGICIERWACGKKKKKNKDRQLLIIGFYWPHLKTMLLCNLITCNCAEAIWSKGASK